MYYEFALDVGHCGIDGRGAAALQGLAVKA